MIAYNISTKIDWNIADEWITWQLEEHIPEIMSTSLFDGYKLYKILELPDDEGATFSVQYFTSDKERYDRYIAEFEAAIRKNAFARWGNQFISYSTVMELVG
jgi:hypothetical protein